METRVTDHPDRSRYEITVDGERAGLAEYRREDGVITFVHTEIDPQHSGQGLAGALIRHALDDARSGQRQVRPVCPFVKGYIAKHPDYLDLVAAEDRTRFGL
ncbi:GNAT family N-acetyltransferase [Streptomyces sp. NPDC058045]|uniref:GNAT family N-acetyltransferase n=1 Tax=Streptomyces sp. NPDC058045 TaxID=3346311 RepID=UPI0036E5C5A5